MSIFHKKNINLGIIIGSNYNDFLSLDEYTNHYLMPFSPRLRSIDFAIASLASKNIKSIIVFSKKDKEYIAAYIMKGWPDIDFYVFDEIDLLHTFEEFFYNFSIENNIQLIALIHGDYPVWFDLNLITKKVETMSLVVLKTPVEDKIIYPAMIIDRPIFIKKFKRAIDEKNTVFTIEKILGGQKVPAININGYIMPIKDIAHYFNIHIDMLVDYHFLDILNSIIPVREYSGSNIISTLKKKSHIINSIVGEFVEINGRVENSVIFSGVKIDENSRIKNSIILPGNHIGRKVSIINSLIDEYSSDNTLPNIEKDSFIGSKSNTIANRDYPDQLNHGFTLIGKDIYIPSHSSIGGNCYIESFISSSKIKSNKILPDGKSILID